MKLETSTEIQRLTLPIREVIAATPRARLVRLDLGGHSFAYQPGQAVLVGTHGDSRRRAYSLAGSPEEAALHGYLELLVGTHEDGQFVRNLPLRRDARLDIEGPVGGFALPATLPARLLFLAAGTGIAPLRAMLRHALDARHRNLCLVYSARTPDEFAYRSELQCLAEQGHLDLRMTVTRDTGAIRWPGAKGRVDRAGLAGLIDDGAVLCFISGPHAFVRDARTLLEDIGISADDIRFQQ